jgi:hypothetical protein
MVFLYFFLFHDFRSAVLKSRILLLSGVLLASLAPHITTGRPAGEVYNLLKILTSIFKISTEGSAAHSEADSFCTSDIRIVR